MSEKSGAQSMTREGTPVHVGHAQPEGTATLTSPQAFTLARGFQNNLEKLQKPHPNPPTGAFRKNASTLFKSEHKYYSGPASLVLSSLASLSW